MERQRLNSLIQQPETLSQVDIAGLEALRDKYPWFSSAHLLLALGELNDERIIVSEKLSRTAVAVPDRSALFEASRKKVDPPAIAAEAVLEIVPESIPVVDSPAPPVVEESPQSEEEDPLDKLIRTEAIRSSVSIELLEAGLKKSGQQERKQPVEEQQAVEPEKKPFSGKMSFTAWLEPDPNLSTGSHSLDPEDMLEQFLSERKKKAKEKTEFFSPARMAKRSLEDHDGLVTDTLAKVYVMQENWSKAIDAYRRLALKYPEKASYYGGLIEELEEQLKND